jgi:predicted nuclease of predicted toxin-antitoxin system
VTFVLDEDMPRSTGEALRTRGHQVFDVRDAGLRGQTDSGVFEFAQNVTGTIVTADRGFANVLRGHQRGYYGILIVNFPNETSTKRLTEALLKALDSLTDIDLRDSLVIVEPGKIRIRSHTHPLTQ